MNKEKLIHRFQTVRQQTEFLCQPLVTEDYVIQSTEDVSPPKWHLAHTSWFFEIFLLTKFLSGYKSFDRSFHYLFNSYYQGIGSPYPRAQRGLLSRPTVETIYAYRSYIDDHILALLEDASTKQWAELSSLLILGLNHEQQHQELLLMDIKHNFSIDPNFPCYQRSSQSANQPDSSPQQSKPVFIETKAGLIDIGHQGNEFCFDNELPVHKKFLTAYLMATQLVTNGEYLEFIAAKGYQNPQYWLADGWDCVLKNNWQAPLYWHNQDNNWSIFTLNGLMPLDCREPVSHISYFEADAYAKWCGARLPSEEEWEHFVIANGLRPAKANFMENGLLHPQAATKKGNSRPQQFFGELWEWTSNPYLAYPGYKPQSGKLGEYHSKFMINQIVLRGGSYATPSSHIRTTYRNFYQPEKRWQFSGIRLASNC